uniref:Uncharacterized protein n=1 Tax=Timema poppense TaxID=170557 RepID=A0A7R9DY24_TIMPO|nr:unnamed protein product [Timema poppensis]
MRANSCVVYLILKAVLEEEPVDIEISFPLTSEFEWIEPQAEPLPGPSAVRSGTPPLEQPNIPKNSLSSSLSKYRANTPEHV